MKHPLNTLRGRLAGKLKEDDLLEIAYRAQGTEDEPMKRALYRLLFDEDKRVAAQAAWVFCHFDRHTDEWLHDKHDALADEAMRTPDVRLRRLLLSLLLRQPFPPERFRTDFFNFCMDGICAAHEPTAVRCLCMKLAYEQCKPFAELRAELQTVLDSLETDLLPTGMRATRHNLLKAIGRQD